MRKNIIRTISIFLALQLVIDQSAFPLSAPSRLCYGPQDLKLKMYAGHARSGAVVATKDAEADLLAANGPANGILLSSGKILISKDADGEDAKVFLIKTHEEIEAILQIHRDKGRRSADTRYARIRDLILANFPPKEPLHTSADLYVNDLVANAISWRLLAYEGFIEDKDVPQQLAPIMDVIDSRKHDLFTSEFWDISDRERMVRKAIYDGMRFYQTYSVAGSVKKALGMPEKVNVEDLVIFHNSFMEMVDKKNIGCETPEGYRITLRELIRVIDIMLEHKEVLGVERSLAWAMRIVYFKRLSTKDKQVVFKRLIKALPSLKKIDDIEDILLDGGSGKADIEVSFDGRTVRGLFNGKVVVEQPMLGEVDRKALDLQKMVFDDDTIREMVDLMFLTSSGKLHPVFLLGPTATGKTSKIRLLSALAGKAFRRIQFNAETDELDLLGHFMPKGISLSVDRAKEIVHEFMGSNRYSELRHVLSILMPDTEASRAILGDHQRMQEFLTALLTDGKKDADLLRAIGHILLNGVGGVELEFKKASFLEALENGDWILLDELNLAREENLGIFYGLLTRGYLEFGGNRIYPKNNGGMIFAAGNFSTDRGRQLLSEALENRFIFFNTPPLSADRMKSIMKEKYPVPGLAGTDIEALVDLNEELAGYAEKSGFSGFDSGKQYRFTIRNLENILINTKMRTEASAGSIGAGDALMTELCAEYRDILDRRDADAKGGNINVLRAAIARHFPGFKESILYPEQNLGEITDGFDGMPLPRPSDRDADPAKILTEKDVDLVMTSSTKRTMRSIVSCFRNPRKPGMLSGQTAVGKTDQVAYAARMLGWQYHSESLRDTPLSKLIGTWERDPATGILIFRDGILTEAMRKGYCLVLEEVNLMDSGLVEVISEWIDEGYLTNPKTHERITVHPDFRLFVTFNPVMGSTRVAQGRNVLPDPFINRFKYIWVNDKTRSEEREIVEELLKKRGLDVSLAGAIASFHESFEKAAALGKIGAESSEGYRTSLRELVRVVNFLSEHRRTLSGREALLWAVREVYVNRLRQADKAHVMASCIEPVLKPNAEDMRTVFGDLNGGCEYEIVRDGARGVIIARANGRTIVEQPVLGVVDEAAVSAQNIVLDNDTKRELADLMLASSQSTLAPVFLMGPTATGKTTKIRYLSALVGKQFTRVQFNAQTDELDLIGHFMPKGVSIKLDDAVRVIQEYLAEGSVFKVQYALSVLLPDDAQKRRALTDAVFARETAAGILSLREGRGEFIRAIAHILINGTTGIEMEFRPGHFLQALTRGDWILLDELNLAREENLGILYGLLTRGYIDIGGTRYDVKKNGGMIFAAGNYSTDVGRQLFSEALENRFQIISYPPLSAKRLGRILYEKYPIAGIGEDDVTRLVGLTRELDDLSKAEVFKGFDGEGAMPFTIRNMENILINAGIRTSWRKDAGSREALIKEIYSEYRDILCRDDANLELLRQAVKKHFGGDTAIPPADLKISDDGIELDGLYFPGPRDTANIDRSRVPTAEDVELVGTPTMLDTMRSALYGFRNPRRPVLLVGPPGAGKTDTIQNLCRLLGWQYHSENLRDTPLSSLLGTWRRDPVTAVLSYKDGILIEAMKKGYCLVFEEINFMETGLLEVISEWIDEGYFINPKTHEKIAVHPDFRFFATMNPIKGANRFSKGRNKLPSPFLNRFKIAWIAEPAYDELVAIMGEIFAKYGLNTGCIKDLVRMHCDFNRWVDQEVFGQETPEGYKVTIRELMRVARFIKKHAPVMGEKEALGWAIKEVYFKRLGKEEEKTLLVNRIISSPALQNIDFTTVFSKEADYSDSHTDAAFAEAALKDLAADSESLCIKVFMNNLSYYIKRGHMEEAFLLLKLLPPPISIKTLRMVTKITPNYIVAIAHAVAKGGPEPARRELLRKVNDILLREKSATHKVLYPLAEAFGVLAASIDQETTLEAYRQFMDMIKEGWGNGPASHGMGFLGPGLSQKEKGWAIDALLNKYLFHNAWSHGPDVARISARIRSVAMIAGTFTDEKDRRRAAEKLLSFRDSHGVGYANDSFSWALRDIAAGISSDELKYNMVEDLLKYAIEEAWPDKKIRSLDTLQAIAVMIKNENLRLKIAEALEGVILRDRPHMLGELVNAYGGVAGSLSYKGARKRSLAIIQSGVSRTEDASKGAALKGLARFLATSDDERAKESMIKAFFSQIGKGLDADSEMKAFESAGILICSLADKDAQQDRINALLDLYDNKTVLPTTAGAFIAALDQFKDKVKDKMQRARILNKVFEIITGVCAHFEMFKSEEFQARISRIIEAMIRDDMRAIERKVIEKEGRAGGKLSRKIKVSELKEGKYAIDIDEASGVLIGKYGGKDLVRQKIFGKIDRERLAAAKLKLNDRVMKDLIDMVFFTSMDELVPVFLLGPTGIGKTAKIRYLSALVGKDFRRVQFNAQTDEFDLIGHFMPKGVSIGYPEASYVVQEHMAKGSWAQLQQALGLVLPTEKMRQKAGTDLEFARRHIEAALYLGKTDGELVRGIAHILLHGASGVELEFRKAEFLLSLERGDWILLDEINLAREESLGVLYGLLTRGYLEYDGKRIDVKSRGGMIFAAGNLSYDLGRQLFSEAFENRFQIFNMSRMGRRDEALILYDLFPIKGISFDDIESLVELNYAMAKLLEAKRFAGFENERPYPFTIRNMIAILSNTAMRLAEPGNTLSSKEAFLKEIFIEYRDILHRDPSNVKLLKNHIALSFQGGAKIPDISFKFTDNDDKIDGISLASPASPGTVDREKIPDIRTADLVYTEGTVDIMRAANYGFKNPRRPVMLIGQPGGGKTDTIAQLARLRGWQYHSENMRDTTLSTLIGTWARDPKSGMLHFKDGVLIEAMKNGTCLVLEEINFMDSGLLEVISEWVDEGYFTNPKTHERIAVHPDFRLFATMNPVQGKTRVALGRNYLPAPFVNRFKLVWVHEKGPQEQFHIIERLLTKAAVATEGRSETFARTEDAIGEAAKAMRERAGTIREQLVSRMIAPESGEEDGEDGEKAPGAKRLLFVEGEQDAGPNAPGGTAAMIENDEGDLDDGKRRRGVEMDVHPDDIVNAKLHQEVQKDPRLLSAIEARAREFHSFFERACKGLVKIRHGRSWAYFSDTETLTYPLDRLLDTPQDKLGAIGFHEGLHRLLTRYNVAKGPDLMPFMDKYTNMLFNAAEDVAIERFGRHLAKGSGEMLDGLYDKLDDKDWLKSHFGDKVPDHVKFAFGALYYGQRGRIPDQLGGKVGEVLRRPDIQKEFDEYFESIPKMKTETGEEIVNTDPTPMEVSAAAAKRLDTLQRKVMKEYKTFLRDDLVKMREDMGRGGLRRTIRVMLGGGGGGSGSGRRVPVASGMPDGGQPGSGTSPGGDPIDGDPMDLRYDDLPEDMKRELDNAVAKYIEELKDRTRAGAPDWEKACKQERDRNIERERVKEFVGDLKEKRGANEGTATETDDSLLRQLERMKDYSNEMTKGMSLYQYNLFTISRLVNILTGQLSNIIRNDTQPRWITNQPHGRDIDWDRFFQSVMSGYSDEKYWRERIIPKKRSIKFTLLIDESGSMSGPRGENALHAAIIFMDVLHNLGIDFSVMGFGSKNYYHKTFRNHQLPKVVNSYDSTKDRNAIMEELASTMSCGGSTADGEALNRALNDIEKYGGDKNVAIVLTDGEGNTGVELANVMKRAESMNVKVIGVGIDQSISYVAHNYKNNVQIPDIETLPQEFRNILRREIAQWFSSDMSRGGVSEELETHPALNSAAQEGRMFALTLAEASVLGDDAPAEELASRIIANVRDIADRDRAKEAIVSRLRSDTYRKDLIAAFRRAAADVPEASRRPGLRICFLQEPEGSPAPVYNDMCHNLVAHAGKGVKTGQNIPSLYFGFNAYRTAAGQGNVKAFTEIVQHECRDLERGYHVDDMPAGAGELYDDTIDLYDVGSVISLALDHIGHGLKPGGEFTIRYDTSRLRRDEIAIVKTYAGTLAKRSGCDVKCVPVSPVRSAGAAPLISVKCVHEGGAGEGSVDVIGMDSGSHILRLTGLLNLAVASSCIPDGAQDTAEYSHIIGFMKRQFRIIMGADTSLPSDGNALVSFMKRLIITLPPAWRMPEDAIRDYYNRSLEALTAA